MIALMRPEQWVKNLFVILPLFFSGKMFSFSSWESMAWAFISFSLAASSVYAINDVIDAGEDRLHPQKCRRPVANGTLSKNAALTVAVACLTGAVALSWLLMGMLVTGAIAAYFVLNLCYCLKLKQIAVLDVLVISLGFVIRLMVGGLAAGIGLSHWIVLMTFLLSLFLALAKRRDDVLIFIEQGIKARGNVGQYNIAFINQTMSIVAAVMIVCYVMYSVSQEVTQRLHTQYVYLTTLFVIAGVIRYMQVVYVKRQSGNPTQILLHDHFIQLCLLGWALSFVAILYL
jgi:4-hydroxybenzoate polyprenyltransferase